MSEQGVTWIRPADRTQGPATPGMAREQAVATEGMWAGVVDTEPGAVTAWHHHGDYESTIFIVSGEFRMEFGPGGGEVIEARPGDFLYVAPHAIHRESNPADTASTAVVVRTGSGGDAVVNVDAPQEPHA